jgi:S-adenosylmethionine decarboxylase proenzyme
MTDPTTTTSHPTIGRHIILDLYDVNYENLCFINRNVDTRRVWDKFISMWFEMSDITCIRSVWNDFNQEGAFTALYLLTESHMSIHTWPEHQYVAIDIFTCGDCNTDILCEKLVDYFEPKYKVVTNLSRGDKIKG